MWINRDISDSLTTNRDLIQIIRGPRQCGKTSLALRLDPSFRELSLDDPALRDLAERDPELFLSQLESDKLFIDEAQYAPRLFPSLKRRADQFKRRHPHERHTIIRLTGPNQIVMDRQVKESLAGRASYFDMNTLSVSEILAAKRGTKIQDILFTGGWPELHSVPGIDAKKYLDNYINSYVEKDVVLAAGISKRREFLKFVALAAGRTGCLLEISSLARDVGVDAKTITEWTSVLETMHLVTLVPPFASNLSSRLVKAPKIYFLDTGLACRMQGWLAPEPILTSPQQGPLFETLVLAEIYKLNINFQLGIKIYHWRSRDGEEIDFLLELSPGEFVFVEAKITARQPTSPHELPQVRKVFGGEAPPLILCHQNGQDVVGQSVPIARLRDYILSRAAPLS